MRQAKIMPGQLAELLELERQDDNLYRGYNRALGGGRVFGGQLIAQALAAAGRTVPARPAHSLHAYFLSVGDPAIPIDYQVERLRDGRSFALRRVIASQQGRPVLHLSASFQQAEEGLEFQVCCPAAPPPESLQELALAEPDRPSAAGRQRSTVQMRVDIRPVPAAAGAGGAVPGKLWWLRVIDELAGDPLLQQCALAYASDFGLLGTAREVHGIGFRAPGMLVASLDHAIWFHRPLRCDDWFLYAMDCPNTARGRGFARGQIFSRDGRLVASVAQEGLIRRSPAGG